jgi:hypothetical protein
MKKSKLMLISVKGKVAINSQPIYFTIRKSIQLIGQLKILVRYISED